MVKDEIKNKINAESSRNQVKNKHNVIFKASKNSYAYIM